ncbi:hypothetical protein ACF064_35290 [Streptomyces sp. NPDC015492]|uniref:hypothetical protein n=1 Tax=Streptomyces sp. NPDC015492 TaxID=3364958 RepID=UPI0036F7DD57
MENAEIRRKVLRVNSYFLMAFGGVSIITGDIWSIWFAPGPWEEMLRGEPSVGIGGLEAHGFAFLFGVMLWRASRTTPTRQWHVYAAVAHTFLAVCNILLWDIYTLVGAVALGYISTIAHVVFATAETVAATRLYDAEPRERQDA